MNPKNDIIKNDFKRIQCNKFRKQLMWKTNLMIKILLKCKVKLFKVMFTTNHYISFYKRYRFAAPYTLKKIVISSIIFKCANFAFFEGFCKNIDMMKHGKTINAEYFMKNL